MACLLHLHAIDATQTKSLFSTLRPHRNVSRGRGASGGFFASDSRWPENFSLSPLAMRWRRRASRRFWRSSNFELRAILLEFSQSLGLKEHSRGFSFCRASALRARRDESLPCLLTNSWKSIEGPPMVCGLGFGGGLCVLLVFTASTRCASRSGTRDAHGGGGGCAAKRSVTSTDVQARACFMCAATPLTCASRRCLDLSWASYLRRCAARTDGVSVGAASTASSHGYGPASRHRRAARKRTPFSARAARTCIA